MASKYCVKCGSFFGSSQYCPSCGAPRDGGFEDTSGETVTSSLPRLAPATSAAPAQARGNNSLVVVLIILVVLAMVGASAAVAVVFLRGDDGSTAVSSAQQPTDTAPGTVQPPARLPVPPPEIPSQPLVPAFTGCPGGFAYAGTSASGRFEVCHSENIISEGFALNVAAAVNGPGQYSGVYSASRDQNYYFSCQYASGNSSVIDCGYPPTNITQGGVIRLYPTR